MLKWRIEIINSIFFPTIIIIIPNIIEIRPKINANDDERKCISAAPVAKKAKAVRTYDNVVLSLAKEVLRESIVTFVILFLVRPGIRSHFFCRQNAALSRKPRPKPRLRSRSGEGVTGAAFAFGNEGPQGTRKRRAGAGCRFERVVSQHFSF